MRLRSTTSFFFTKRGEIWQGLHGAISERKLREK